MALTSKAAGDYAGWRGCAAVRNDLLLRLCRRRHTCPAQPSPTVSGRTSSSTTIRSPSQRQGSVLASASKIACRQQRRQAGREGFDAVLATVAAGAPDTATVPFYKYGGHIHLVHRQAQVQAAPNGPNAQNTQL